MNITITLCTQPKQKRRKNESYNLFFGGGETESLSQAIEFGAPASFQF